MGRHGADGPMGFLGELMDILPVMGRNGQAFHFHITGPSGTRDARELGLRATRIEQRRENVVQEPWQAVSFTAQNTLDRYEEEARMLFGGTLIAEAAKLSNMISAILTPAAVEAEKKRMAEEAERKKRAEEERLKRDEEERRIREAKEAEEKAAREKLEAEEREAAARAASEAAANNDSQASQESGPGPDGGSAMEGIEGAEANDAGPSNTSVPSDQPRVMAMLGDQEIDVTDLGIDPDYLAALPEEFREEVIAQAVSARRSEARAEAPAGESTVAFQEFLDALPVQLRREIEQQEAQEQRRRDNGNSRPAASSGGPEIVSGDMDTASILLTFPQELRDQVLLEQGNEIMEHLPPEMAEQARRLQRSNAVPHPIPGHRPVAITRTGQQPPPPAATESKPQRRTVVQMLDKAGVATLVRLMFIAQQGSIRNYLFSVFADVCENRQNRLEVISTILQILQEGSTDMSAVDRSFSHLSLKARRHNREKDLEQKTPQSLKKSLTALNSTITSQTNSETSPLLIVQQCLDLLVDLCTRNPGIPWLFLTEHETVGSTLRKTLGRKGKSKDTKAHKYAINSLLTLLDRDLVMESSVVMTHLADLLNRVTIPLLALDRRRKEAEEEVEEESAPKSAEAQADQEPNEPNEPSVAAGQASGESAAPNQPTTTEGGPSAGDDAKTSQKDDSRKKARQIQPPVIPPQNLTLVIRVFVARECSSKTFQNTINTIKNLSTVPGARSVFGQELVRQARLLSENIVTDLDELLPHIEKATSGTEIQGVALSKFSPGASEQNKLLRVLTALDHLFDGKKKSNGGENDKPDSEKQDLVTSLYHNSTFSAMWDKLGACLTAIHERENMFNVATILLPLIESLMVVCKNTTTQDDPSQAQLSKEMVLSSPPPESRTASLFFSFTEDHRRILNELVRNNPKLMSGTFALLVKNPKVLEFDNKRNYFNRSVHSRSGQPHHGRPSFPTLNLSVRRDQVFHDSFKSLYFKSGDEMKFGKLNIRFHGEEGVDAGGVTREWFQVLARQMFDANYALFIPVSSDRTTFHPNKLSGINDEHLMFFKFIGRIIGKALYEGRVLDCYFSRAVYKRILGKSVSVKDMESFDPDYYKSLCWMLENDITDIITETFSVEDDEFGVTKVVDLIPNGREIPVTDENKQDYVRLVVEHKLLSSVKDQMEHFLKGKCIASSL
jgi:E3 ubiquitin-protein ligase HUWE1